MRRLPAALPALALAACSPGFTPQYLVTSLRVLAVRAQVVSSSFADADPGTGGYPSDTLRLEALVGYPNATAPVAFHWYACVPVAGQALPPCLDPAYLADPQRLGTSDAAALGVVDLAAFGTPSPDGSSIDVPLSGSTADPRVALAMETAYQQIVAKATSDPQFQCTPYVEVPIVLTAEAGNLRDVAVRTVRLAPMARLEAEYPDIAKWYVRNAVPAISGLFADPPPGGACSDGTPIPPGGDLPAGHHVLCGAPAADAVQSYWQCGGDGVNTLVDERLDWQWYATAGTFSDANSVGNVIDDAPVGYDRPPVDLTLWVIVRDGRGGESWASRTFPAPP